MPTAVREAVDRRARGRCEMCGLPAPNAHLHHRQPRGAGSSTLDPHTLSNLLRLHPICHLVHVEQARERAYHFGWLVRHGYHPSTVPVLVRGSWCRLHPDGSVVPCTAEEVRLLTESGADDRSSAYRGGR
jgi:hypothetical protein